ncbi:MAG: putative ABC transporter permease [Bacilli bacterium]|nr:putative ABC transporter permease [Bacilli bacterium]
MKDLTKKQKITLICLLIVISGIIGWLYEFIFYYANSGFKTFYFRGGNFLPWINIYMYGSFLILFLTRKVKKHPILVFLISLVSTGVLEYLSGYILYGVLGWTKCWDYNNEILNWGNIDGYVCLRSVLIFGLAGLALVYLIVPTLIKLVKKYPKLYIISIILASIFLFDEVYNLILHRIFNLPDSIELYKSIGFKYLFYK